MIWSESDKVPNHILQRYSSYQESSSLAGSIPIIYFDVQTIDSLNNRFKPLPPNTRTEAILSVDDDMRIPCDELSLSFEVWRNSPRNLIGFMPRLHVAIPNHPAQSLRANQNDGDKPKESKEQTGIYSNVYYAYRCWWKVWARGEYSMILTKAAILHHDFFHAYFNILPKTVFTYIDDRRNCEDIAMQFLASNMTGLPPIYVKGHLSDKGNCNVINYLSISIEFFLLSPVGALGGISTSQNVVKAKHMQARDECVNDLIQIFGRNPLQASHVVIDAAYNGWTHSPSTWLEYISSDLWKWN